MRMAWLVVLGVGGVAAALPAAAQTRISHSQARARVFADPLKTPPSDAFYYVPELAIPLRMPDVLGAFSRIVREPTDFRQDGGQKVVHRWGVCADGVWEITEASPYTGLFTPGTRVPVLMRLATGSNRTFHMPLATRTWGVAVKLFPARDPQTPVVTRNLVLFDQYGLDGQARAHFVTPATGDPPLYWTNHIRAAGLLSQGARWLLGRFDDAPLYRSLVPLADVDQDGVAPFAANAPVVLTLHVRHHPLQDAPQPSDYRDEIRAYPPGELIFDVVVPPQVGHPQLQVVGTLTVGETVLSPTCDGALHFWHPPVPPGSPLPPGEGS